MAHAEEEPPDALPEVGLPGDAALELPAAGANQVIADVRAARRRACCTCDLPGALHALQRHAQLALAGRLGQLLDRVAIAVAAAEVHPAVDAGRIALQHLLDQADALEELAPVERRDQAQAADQVGHRTPARPPDAVLRRGSRPRSSRRVPPAPHRARAAAPRRSRRSRARALQQPGDERRMHLRRPLAGARGRVSSAAASRSACHAMRARLGEHVAARAQVIDQRELQRARPRPQLAHRQRRDRLEGGDESLQPLRVEPAGAASRSARARARRCAASPANSSAATTGSRLKNEGGRSWWMSRAAAEMMWKLSSSHSAAGDTASRRASSASAV